MRRIFVLIGVLVALCTALVVTPAKADECYWCELTSKGWKCWSIPCPP